jgi:hypothetical protein
MSTPKINKVEAQKNVVEIKLPLDEKETITQTPSNTPQTPSIQQSPPVLVVLEWDRTVIDMGIVAPGSKQKYEFNYLGTKKITDVKTSCGCTSALTKGSTISGVWTISSDYSAVKEVESLTSRTVTATFNDGSKQVLTLKATVNKMFKIQK